MTDDDDQNEMKESQPDKRMPLSVDGGEIYRFLTTQYLHQNQMSWSRLQTIFVIQAGLLAWFFAANTHVTITVVGMILGSIVI